jgi:GT2 family glycosyltransferase
MQLSVIVVTRNRAHQLAPCLNSILVAIDRAQVKAQLIVVDNGSSDGIANVLARSRDARVQALQEPRLGKARGLNRALDIAKGELLAFIDDDCRTHPDYVQDLLRHYEADTEPVLRGGRIELGDPTDLPFTINTSDIRKRWHIALDSTRREAIAGDINGCNMVMPRALIERIGPFDEDFGPGSRMESCDDADMILRAYTAGAPIEYVPDMTVYHHHGRKTDAQIAALFRRYHVGWGAVHAKHLFQHPVFYRDLYRHMKAMRLISVAHQARGALRYFLRRRSGKREISDMQRFGDTLVRLGLNEQQAAKILGVKPSAVKSWADMPKPILTALLLAYLEDELPASRKERTGIGRR